MVEPDIPLGRATFPSPPGKLTPLHPSEYSPPEFPIRPLLRISRPSIGTPPGEAWKIRKEIGPSRRNLSHRNIDDLSAGHSSAAEGRSRRPVCGEKAISSINPPPSSGDLAGAVAIHKGILAQWPSFGLSRLRARPHLRRREKSLRAAIKCLERAVEHDPYRATFRSKLEETRALANAAKA